MAAETAVTKERKAPPAAGEVGPHGDEVAYLVSKGWKCLGNPDWPTALWLDPTQPLVAHYTEEDIFYDHEVREQSFDPATGTQKTRYRIEKRQVLAQDGSGGALVAAKRSVFHPKGTPITRVLAMVVQVERDAADQLARDRERQKAEGVVR